VEQLAGLLEEQNTWLQTEPIDPGRERTLTSIAQRLGALSAPLSAEVRNAEAIASVSRLMEDALRYSALVQAQERVVRRLEREGDAGRIRDAALYRSLQSRQEDIRGRLAHLRDAIRTNAAALPPEEPELRDSAVKFADRIDELAIVPTMEQAVAGARNQDGSRFFREAKLALEKMKQLLSDCSGDAMGGLAANCEMRFQAQADMLRTLRQMLNAWRMGAGMGRGQMGGAGMGIYGQSADGYSMEGYSPMNVPTYGPQRSSYGREEPGTGLQGGAGEGLLGERVKQGEAERMNAPKAAEGAGQTSTQPVRAPEKYREALKKYFSGGRE
jgi:hypothetical protein